MTIEELRAAIEALPTHSITGPEWDCYEPDTGCHWHWPREACKNGHTFDREGDYDRDDVPCDHKTLIDRTRLLALLDA